MRLCHSYPVLLRWSTRRSSLTSIISRYNIGPGSYSDYSDTVWCSSPNSQSPILSRLFLSMTQSVIKVSLTCSPNPSTRYMGRQAYITRLALVSPLNSNLHSALHQGHQVRAVFFILSWTAQIPRYSPDVVFCAYRHWAHT